MLVKSYFKPSSEIEVTGIEIIRINRIPDCSQFVNGYWDETDINSILFGYEQMRSGKLTLKEVANKMGKSYYSIKNKARRMGIARRGHR